MPTKVGQDREDPLLRPIERPATKPHDDLYAAALITPFGIKPIVSASDAAELKMWRKPGTPAMLYGLSVGALHAGQSERETWISGSGIATPDGAGLFELRDVDVDV